MMPPPRFPRRILRFVVSYKSRPIFPFISFQSFDVDGRFSFTRFHPLRARPEAARHRYSYDNNIIYNIIIMTYKSVKQIIVLFSPLLSWLFEKRNDWHTNVSTQHSVCGAIFVVLCFMFVLCLFYFGYRMKNKI